MRRLFTFAGALVTAACAGSLSPGYPATLSASRSTEQTVAASTFAIEPVADISSEALGILRSGLEARGMKSAPPDQADVVVSVEYTLSGPTPEKELISVPIYRTITTPGRTQQQRVGTDKDGRPIYTTVTTAGTSTEQYVGENVRCSETLVYDKRLRLSGRAAGHASAEPVWEVSVTVRDNVKDPMKYAPMLARAAVSQTDAAPQVGTLVTLADGGRKVKAVKDTATARAPTLASVRCDNQNRTPENPAFAIRNAAACMSRPIFLAHPVYGSTTVPIGLSMMPTRLSTTMPIGLQNNSCLPGVLPRPGDGPWR